jgi:hypothetical protein
MHKPLSLLHGAEHALLLRAGAKCARPSAARKLVPHTGGSGSPQVQPPGTDPEQGEGENHLLPLGKLVIPKSIGGTSALGGDPHQAGLNPASRPLAHIATDPFSFFRNSDVGVPPRQASPQEPTTAIAPAAGVVWYTGNTSDALSTDNGKTFTRFDPSSVLPDQGLAYCCDQVVSYSPQRNIFVWVSQYWCNKSCLVSDGQTPPHNVCRNDGVFNRIRIAVATPQALKANATNPGAAWTYWDITPSTIGERGGNAWFDRSDMSVNPLNFNWGVDIMCGQPAGADLARAARRAWHGDAQLRQDRRPANRGAGARYDDHVLHGREQHEPGRDLVLGAVLGDAVPPPDQPLLGPDAQ